MKGFVLELNKRETPQAAKPDAATAPLDIRSMPLAPPSEAEEDMGQDGIGAFRGLAIGLPVAIVLWIAIIATVAYVIA